MTDEERAEQAWQVRRDAMGEPGATEPLRKREFIAGFLLGVKAERDHTREYVTPMNLKLYQLVRDLDENPELATHIKIAIPETVKKLVTFLETGALPKEKR